MALAKKVMTWPSMSRPTHRHGQLGEAKEKGYLFITGDELPYPAVSRHQIEALVGEKLDEDIPVEEVVAAAETYHVFFLIPDLERRKRCRRVGGSCWATMPSAWNPRRTCAVAAAIVGLTEKLIPDLDALAGILSNNGFDRQHVGSTIRALWIMQRCSKCRARVCIRFGGGPVGKW